MWRLFAPIPLRMELAGKIVKVESKPMRLVRKCRRFENTRIFGQPFDESYFAGILQPV